MTQKAALLLESLGVAVLEMELVLLVGETGVGKTAAVQFLAHQLGHPLRIINMNQQSDVADLLGGSVVLISAIATFSTNTDKSFSNTIEVCLEYGD